MTAGLGEISPGSFLDSFHSGKLNLSSKRRHHRAAFHHLEGYS
ncbi:hypothetical protein [Planococcus shixiaomingii]|nr:hypothetical protein [Planococcus sp. N028]